MREKLENLNKDYTIATSIIKNQKQRLSVISKKNVIIIKYMINYSNLIIYTYIYI